MISKWHNTKIEQAAKMYDVTDEDFRAWSDGQVYTTEENKKGNLEDPEIFGNIEEPSQRMGHIELPIPVVNINYTYGNPVLHTVLGISFKELSDLIYCRDYVVVEPGESGLEKGQFISVNKWKEIGSQGVKLKYGAEAVEYLLKEKNIPDPEKYIFHTLPVLPLQCRFLKYGDSYYPHAINYMTAKIVIKCNRIRKLEALNFPEVVMMNEKRIFQEQVDTYINNGARGIPVLSADGIMMESCHELYSYISSIYGVRKNWILPDVDEDEKIAVRNALLDYEDFISCDEEIGSEKEKEEDVVWEVDLEKENALKEKITEAFESIINKTIDCNFKEYESFREAMVAAAENTVLKTISSFDREEDNTELFHNAIIAGLSCFVDKQVKLIGIQ